MPNRPPLIIHCMLPGGADDVLAVRYFNPLLPPLARLRLTDPMHQTLRRWPEALGPAPASVRLVGGRLPIGYFEAQTRRALHVCVLNDPEAAFLRLPAALAQLPPETVLRLTGLGPAMLADLTPEDRVLRLLSRPEVRRRHVGVTARLLAGLPRLAGKTPPASCLLPAARAALARIDVLAGVDEELDGFAAGLSATFGWPAPPLSLAPALPALDAAPRDLPRPVRDALRAALELDLRLYDSARDLLSVSAA